MKEQWLYNLKRKILVSLLGILTLSILVTLAFIGMMLREHLLTVSKASTQELSQVVETSLKKLMLIGKPEVLQEALAGINTGKISTVFIVDRNGKVVYASDRAMLGRLFDRHKDTTCTACHKSDRPPQNVTTVIKTEQGKFHRIVSVICNDSSCHGCHSPSQRIIGKLIIDRSLKDNDRLILEVLLIIVAAGVSCILFLWFFVSRKLSSSLDKYIDEILRQNSELSLLCTMIERLSKTIDIDELKPVVIDIFREVLDADEIDIILRKDARELRCTSWMRGNDACQRKKLESDAALAQAVERWKQGVLNTAMAGGVPSELYVPIEKNGGPLALIHLVKYKGGFDPFRLMLVDVVVNNVSVSFEKASLYYIAITDELTHLYTLRHFRFCLESELRRFEQSGTNLTLLMIDIDNFKLINDTHGHPVGDLVIEQVAKCLLMTMRDNDLSFRYGGEEFAVLLPDTARDGGLVIAERIRKRIEEMVVDERYADLGVTVSIGVATLTGHADSGINIVGIADGALYEAKRAGKNRVIVAGQNDRR